MTADRIPAKPMPEWVRASLQAAQANKEAELRKSAPQRVIDAILRAFDEMELARVASNGYQVSNAQRELLTAMTAWAENSNAGVTHQPREVAAPSSDQLDHQPGQLLQALAVGAPVFGAGRGQAAVVVEVYAPGAGIAFARDRGDLLVAGSAFELESPDGGFFVIDPLGVGHAHRLVLAVEGYPTPVIQRVQAVDQENAAEFVDVDRAHGVSSVARTVILSLPQGVGKTTHAEALRDFFGCASIVDEWPSGAAIRVGALHLTNAEVPA